jgi:carboxymethylenebutenolidase
MTGKSEWFTYDTPGSGTIRAFAVRPDAPAPWPALILIHGVNGTGPHTVAKAEAFAVDGYYTMVPDIYTNDAGFKTFAGNDILSAAHMGPDPAKREAFLAHVPEGKRAEIVRARDWISDRPASTYIEIVRGCFDHLKSRRDIASIGTVGYCMGGRLVAELAVTGAELSAGVIYYGGNPKLEQVPNIRCAIQGHYASTDHGITGKVPEFEAAMKKAGKEFTYYVYEADHGFSLVPGTHGYDARATELSLERIRPFLARTLKAAAVASAAS